MAKAINIGDRILRDDGDFKTRSLDTEEEYIYTTFHQEEILTFSEVATIENYKYYQPLSENFPSFDSIHAPKSLFQMTTSLNHPIKMNGLKKVHDKLTRSNVDFYFVVPMELFYIFKSQRFVTSKKKEPKNIPPWFGRIKQYVLGIDLSSKSSLARSSSTASIEIGVSSIGILSTTEDTDMDD